jgi:hypothetical protein
MCLNHKETSTAQRKTGVDEDANYVRRSNSRPCKTVENRCGSAWRASGEVNRQGVPGTPVIVSRRYTVGLMESPGKTRVDVATEVNTLIDGYCDSGYSEALCVVAGRHRSRL